MKIIIKNRVKRITALLLTIFLSMSLFVPDLTAMAQGEPEPPEPPESPTPKITGILYVFEKNLWGQETLWYEISGTGFDEPTVNINQKDIKPASYNSKEIKIKQGWSDDPVGEAEAFSEGIKKIAVVNADGKESDEVIFEVVPPLRIEYTDKHNPYEGTPLKIFGSDFSKETIKDLFVAGRNYSVGDEGSGKDAIIENGETIFIEKLKAPLGSGLSSIWIKRNAGDGTDPEFKEGAIWGMLSDCITIVKKLTGIEVASIEPNTGPYTGGTVIRMYGVEGSCNFTDNMKVYIGDNLATDVKTIKDDNEKVIGLQAMTPPGEPGGQKIVIMDDAETSGYEVGPEFTYLQTGNFLTVRSVEPNTAKETEEAEITVSGRNIATINISGVDHVDTENYSGSYDVENEEYVLEFTGTYKGRPVDITRRIKLTIGDVAEVTEIGLIHKDGDSIKAKTPIITLDPPVAQGVDVVIQTETIINEASGDKDEILRRTEEYVSEGGFTYMPSRTYPEITDISPGMGPFNQEIYITITGSKFQVQRVTDEVYGNIKTLYPEIKIGTKTINPNEPDGGYMEIYDDEGNRLEGSKYRLGNVIKTVIPAEPEALIGYADVTITNPDKGHIKVDNLFEFKDPDRLDKDMPEIISIDPGKGSVDGGEAVTIYGRNFDSIGDVIVTIDGATAEVQYVDHEGTKIDIITPPGTGGHKTVQVINDDGSMATMKDGYYYTRVKSDPVIDIIAPDHGGAGTQVIIKGRDFFKADPEADLIYNKLGTRVHLNGVDIDDYEVDENGDIEFLNGGERTKVIDEYTIKITIPPDLVVGPKDVTVVNPDTAGYTVYDGFVYQKPRSEPKIYGITDGERPIDPDRGTVEGGTVVTIEGEDFRPGARVFFGGSEAVDVKVNVAQTVIRVTTSDYSIKDPNKGSEKVDVTVVNYDGGSATEEDGFTYMLPESNPIIYSVEPGFGSAAGGEMVTILGRDFRDEVSEETVRPPDVYFGGIRAKNVEMISDERLYAETPPCSEEGKVDITIINADAGTYVLKNGYEYRSSRPRIFSVIPGKGSKNGGQEIVIRGEDFKRSDLSSYYEGERVTGHVYGKEPLIDLLVVFGDEKTEEQRIIGGIAEAALGNIRASFKHKDEEGNTKLYYTSPEGGESPIASYEITPGSKHLFIIKGLEDLGDENIADEGILVEVTAENTFKMTRGVAPHAQVIDGEGTTVAVKTPPVPYVGVRGLQAINEDGGIAETTFEYTNPDSNPIIHDIQPRREMYDGEGQIGGYQTVGSVDADTYVTIDGADFRTGVRVFVGDIEAEVISRSNTDDQLVIRVPRGREELIDRLLEFVIENRDGGTTHSADPVKYHLPRWFTYKRPESAPTISFVVPDRTSAAGGNRLEIKGDDFKAGATVAIGGIQGINTALDDWSYKNIIVETPAGIVPGTYDLQVINPDYGTATLRNGITVISWPRINYVADENGNVTDALSFLGGEIAYIKGNGFMDGARVVFGGEILPLTEVPEGVGLRGFNSVDRYVAVVDGKEAPSVEVIDDKTLKIITPAGFEGDNSIVVINNDGGISDTFGIGYEPPIPDAPDGLEVSLVYDRYVRLEWPAVEGALYYEIYARKDSRGEFSFIESTTRTIYYITDLDSKTRYYFKVKAINKFGSSELTRQRSIRTDDTREEDLDGVIDEEEKILVDGNSVTVNLPTDVFSRQYYYNIDLSDNEYAGIGTKVVSIPLSVIRDARGTFVLNTGDVILQFSPRVFNTAPLWNVVRHEIERAYGRLTVRGAKNDGERALKYLPAKQRPVSSLYYIGLSAAYGKTEEDCDRFNGQLYMQIKYQDNPFRDISGSSLKLCRFNASVLRWEPVAVSEVDRVSQLAAGYITMPGIYAVLGEN